MKLFIVSLLSCLHLFAATLSVNGEVQQTLHFDKESFAKLPHTTLSDVAVVCASGQTKQAAQKKSGVLLIQLIQNAHIDIKSKKKLNQVVVLATAMDDYAVAFSYNELFNTDIGNAVIVVYENEGFSLYSKKDFLTGSRHVYALENIQVRMIQKNSY
ncbi:MAG: hypothetical protein ACNI3C_07880 [Candidatus Marinarcus sp.]|uniref:hypothetical protein n=1 Tax=Candidatus Marinarcus sp. TaxID=3100987 RepID=UPI003B00E5E4